MLDFRSKKPPKNYLARGQQWRLLALVMIAGLVVLAVSKSGNPSNWLWLFGQTAKTIEESGSSNTAADPDTRLSNHGSPIADSFVSPAAPGVAEEHSSRPSFPGVRSDYLAAVKDNTVLRGAETDAWFHLLKILQQSDSRELEKASLGDIGFVELFRQPEVYRGQVVTLRGIVHRAEYLKAPQNAYGIAGYHRLWLVPSGGPASPIVLYALELPQGYPEGLEITAESRATGFFFKRLPYEAKDGLRTAPLVLARTVAWQPPPEAPASADSPTLVKYALAALGAGAIVVAAVYWTTRRKPRIADRLGTASEAGAAPDLSMLRGADTRVSVGESLQGLARRE